MATDVNKVTLMGNVGRDPEFHQFASGDRVGKFSVATNVNYQKDGEWKSNTTWHEVECFDQKLNDRIEQQLAKGSRVYLEGRLKMNEWEQDGVKRTKIIVEMPKFGSFLSIIEKGEAVAPAPAAPAGEPLNDEIPW